MPLYEYECDACGRRFEAIQRVSDPALTACTLCEKGPVRRLLSSPAIQFKGSGWYITDYAQKGQKDRTEAGAAESAKTEAKKAGDAAGGSDAGASGKTETPASPTPAPASKA